MTEMSELFEMVAKVAVTRPGYSLPHFLPRQVLELGVLNMLAGGDRSGDYIIRELAPLTRKASGYGVNYPLLHEMEAQGYLLAYQPNNSPRRVYSITEAGLARLEQLETVYNGDNLDNFQTGFSLVYGLNKVRAVESVAFATEA